MWAPIIAVDRGATRVGIRPATDRVARRVRRHLGDAALDETEALSNFSVLGPVWRRWRPGRLMRDGVDIARSWRMTALLRRLDGELTGIGPVPDGLLRLRCQMIDHDGGRAIVGRTDVVDDDVRTWWVDPRRQTVIDPPTQSERPLRGVFLGDRVLGFEWLTRQETIDSDAEAWIDLLDALSRAGRIHRDGDVPATSLAEGTTVAADA